MSADVRGEDGSLNPGCTDKAGNPAWSCVEWDGTGLWCDSCLALAEARDPAISASPVKISHRAPLNVIDGVPQCPCCHEPAAEVAPGRWQCHLSVLLFGNLADVVGPAIDRYLAEAEDGTP